MEKKDWPRDGARNPVEPAARSDEGARHLETSGDLDVRGVPEVAVVLEAAGHAEPERVRDVRLGVRVNADAVAGDVDLVGRAEAREDLRSRRGLRAELVRDPAVDVRVRLAGDLLVVLAPVLGAEGDVERPGEADRELARNIEVPDDLPEDERARVELALRSRSARERC